MKLRGYQLKVVRGIRSTWKQHSRVLLVLPTGAGKTVVAAHEARAQAKLGRRVLFLVHRQELLTQAVRRLRERGVSRVGVIAPRTKFDTGARVVVGSIATLSSRKRRGCAMPPFDVVIVDEAHHGPADTWAELLDHYSDSGARILGLTATPWREDGKSLRGRFDAVATGPSYEELYANGDLARPKIYSWKTEDLRGAKVVNGDYAPEVLERIGSTIIGDVVAHWLRDACGLPTVVYAASIKHAESIAERFRGAGVRVALLTGETPQDERQQLNDGLSNGSIQVVVNVAVLTEGWDMSAVRVAMIARPTRSLVLYRQMCGRVMRLGERQPMIFDHCGNVLLLGAPWKDWGPPLGDPPKIGKHGDIQTRSRECPTCGSAVSMGSRACLNCGHEFWSAGSGVENEIPDEEHNKWLEEIKGGASLMERAVEAVREGMTRKAAAEMFGLSSISVERACLASGIPKTTNPVFGITKEERAALTAARRRAYRAENIESIRDREREHKRRLLSDHETKQKLLERQRLWYANNAEKVKQKVRAYKSQLRTEAAE